MSLIGGGCGHFEFQMQMQIKSHVVKTTQWVNPMKGFSLRTVSEGGQEG
jgi:hypothetical protein